MSAAKETNENDCTDEGAVTTTVEGQPAPTAAAAATALHPNLVAMAAARPAVDPAEPPVAASPNAAEEESPTPESTAKAAAAAVIANNLLNPLSDSKS